MGTEPTSSELPPLATDDPVSYDDPHAVDANLATTPRRVTGGMLARLSTMMYLEYLAIGIWSVPVGAYIATNTAPEGRAIFDSTFVGTAGVSGALGSLLAPIIFGSLADGLFPTQRILAVLNVLCAGALVILALAESQWLFFIGMLLYFQFASPTTTLTNSLCFRHFQGDPRAYPLARASGTLGWIVALLLVGSIVPLWLKVDTVDGTLLPMWLGVGSHLIVAVYALTLPHTPPLQTMVSWRTIAGGWMTLLRREPRMLRFLAVMVLATIGPRLYDGFLNAYLNQIGVKNAASWMAIAQVAEIGFIMALPVLLVSLGPKRTIFIGLIAWIFRYILLYYGGPTDWPFVLTLLAIAQHGFCYVMVYLSGYMYVDKIAPPEQSGVAQGLFAMATSGVGHMVGSLFVGQVQGRLLTPPGVTPPPYDWPSFWLVGIGMSALTVLMFWWTMGLKREVYLDRPAP